MNIHVPSKEFTKEILARSYDSDYIQGLSEDDLHFIDMVYENPDMFQVRAVDEEALVIFGLMNEGCINESTIGYNTDAIFIYELYVTEAYRGQGYGSQLLQTVVDWKNKHFQGYNIYTCVDKENVNAKCFYEDYGFQIISEYDEYREVMMKVRNCAYLTESEDNLKFKISKKKTQKMHGVVDWNDTFNMKRGDPVARVFDGEEVVGQAMLEDSGDVLWVYFLAVDPGCRGKGIGTRLMKCIEKYARKNGYKAICLHPQKVFEDNLLPWYSGLGFETLYREPECNNEWKMIKHL